MNVEPLEDEPEPYLLQHVRDAIANDPRVNELDVHLSSAGGKVFLAGHVSTKERRDALGEVVRELLPGYIVVNQVSVPETSEPPEVESFS